MKKDLPYLLCCFLLAALAYGQQPSLRQEFVLQGKVVAEGSQRPLEGIEVRTDQGAYTRTDSQGAFTIRAAAGDQLTVSGSDLVTVRYHIRNDEDLRVVVQGLDGNKARPQAEVTESLQGRHRRMLDSANFYKETDIARSLDFITRSIEMLDDRSSRRELALSLTTLGEIYQFHGQHDLASANFREALDTFWTPQTLLLLGRVRVLAGAHREAIEVLEPEVSRKGLQPIQSVELFETLGDAYRGLEEISTAVAYYQRALTLAEKSQIGSKVPDLNSKIADAYAVSDRKIEAEAYYGNSLRQAAAQNPARAVQENEKVADYYSRQNRYPEEIALRKQSLQTLESLEVPAGNAPEGPVADSITRQGVNYKIGRAYIAQSRYDEAIPFLDRSIREAGSQGDLVVQKDATRKLSEVYRDRGDFEKALGLYQQYVALVDTLYVRKEQELARAARFSQEMASSQSRIMTLEQERELSRSKYNLALAEQRLTQEINKRQRYIIYSLILGLLLTGLAAFFYYRSNRQKELANYLLALKGLRSQMNPHFIFNALNSVNNYIARNDERSANRYLSDFSQLMRTVLENSEKDFIPLSEELELLELYLKLEHARFPDKFEYEISTDPGVDLEAFQIPPMLLQPYLENAVWHGLRYKEEKGTLLVAVKPLAPRAVTITVTDNGIGRKRSAAMKTRNQQKQQSRGMGNIRRRVDILNRMYGDRITVSVYDLNPDGSGTKVVLNLRND